MIEDSDADDMSEGEAIGRTPATKLGPVRQRREKRQSDTIPNKGNTERTSRHSINKEKRGQERIRRRSESSEESSNDEGMDGRRRRARIRQKKDASLDYRKV